MGTSPLKTRLTLTADEVRSLTALLRAAQHPASLLPKAFEDMEKFRLKVHEAAGRKRLLQWKPGDAAHYYEAVIGSEKDGDGARFTLEYVGTCYRRGRWKLLVEVFEGPKHHDWGCFDSADQPMRWYHVLENAIEEAEAVAAVLLADRMERGSIPGWVPPNG